MMGTAGRVQEPAQAVLRSCSNRPKVRIQPLASFTRGTRSSRTSTGFVVITVVRAMSASVYLRRNRLNPDTMTVAQATHLRHLPRFPFSARSARTRS